MLLLEKIEVLNEAIARTGHFFPHLVLRRGMAHHPHPSTGLEINNCDAPAGADVLALARERRVGARVAVHETIALPLPLFARLDVPVDEDLAEELYVLYQRDCAVTVTRAEDGIAPEPASAQIARSLGVAPGTPILRIARIAHGLDGGPVEYRVSRTARLDYAVALE